MTKGISAHPSGGGSRGAITLLAAMHRLTLITAYWFTQRDQYVTSESHNLQALEDYHVITSSQRLLSTMMYNNVVSLSCQDPIVLGPFGFVFFKEVLLLMCKKNS